MQIAISQAACQPAPSRRPMFGLRFMCLLLLLASCILPSVAWADCGFASGAATTVTFNAGTIILTPSTQIGATLWTSNVANPANPPVLVCDGNTNGGILNIIAASTPVNGDNTLMPTGIPGISYRLLHPDASTKLALYPNYPTGSGTFSVSTNLELVYTGPYLPPNNASLTGQLAQWKIDICDNPNIYVGYFNNYYLGCYGSVAPRPVETFNISAIIKIQVPTCDIATGSVSKTVPLPGVSTTQLTANQTTGKTPFSLQLINCPSGQKVYINLTTSSPYTGANGVIAPTTGAAGYATNVGVQILKADGSTAVTFGTTPTEAIFTGTATSSNYTIDLYARYFRTGMPVSAGLVQGIASYTVNYK